MVQSPHFDGKVPNWFHFHCFFAKFKAKEEGDFGKFDSIRWDDQERLREKLNNSGGVTGAASGGKSKKKTKNGSVDVVDGPSSRETMEFSIEYAKSSRAKCRKCEEKIEKGVIRISKLMEPEEKKFAAQVPHWHHVECFLLRREELEAETFGAADIPGFSSLSAEDQKEVSAKVAIPKTNTKKLKQEEKPSKEEQKKANAEKDAQKKQNDRYWKVRDGLYQACTNSDLKTMLSANGYDTTGGEDSLLDRCADGVLFGALELCPECKNGRLVLSTTKNGYKCTGNVSGWTACTYLTQKPARKMWLIPTDLRKESDFLTKIKLKVRERIFPNKLQKDEVKEEKEVEGKPLQNKIMVLVGRLKQTQSEMKEKVESLGGSITSTPTPDCFCCISNPGEVAKGSVKMGTVEKYNIPVVTEEYLDALDKTGGAKKILTQYAIAPWGGNREQVDTSSKSQGTKRKNTAAENASGGGASKKSKLTVKGGAVVDTDTGLEDTHHILNTNKVVYAAVLGLVDLSRGSNSYYKLQILEPDDTKKTRFYYLFRAWGRVGTSIGGNKLEKFLNKENAIEHFEDLYYEKTGNEWGNRTNFVKQPNKFYPLDIDYGQEDEEVQSRIAPGSKSTLSKPTQELMKMIFDIEEMKHALLEFEIDLKKMPLGKLSKKQIETAYTCLTQCQGYLQDEVTGSKVLDASNRFFTLIPHDFGLKTPPLLDNEDIINSKVKMLDSLLEIEIAYSLLKGGSADQEQDPLDVHYTSLKADIKEVDKESDEYKMICEYVQNTHAKTHSHYKLKVQEVFAVDRKGEKKRYRAFRDLPNRQLLWHGSRRTNFAGIISQGLRIAPPEAPVTGYMFGKGVYFADLVSKSANYCYTNRKNNVGLMMLCEVALGNMHELLQADHITKLPAGKHSCKGLGGTGPDPSSTKTLPDGVQVPLGKPIKTGVDKSSLLYNEYIVYDTAQISMKYLVQLDFQYKF